MEEGKEEEERIIGRQSEGLHFFQNKWVVSEIYGWFLNVLSLHLDF